MLGFPWMPRDRLRKFTCFCEDFTARGVLAETLPARTGLITWGPPSIREAGGARERVPWLSRKRPARPRSVAPAPLPCVFALFASEFSARTFRSEFGRSCPRSCGPRLRSGSGSCWSCGPSGWPCSFLPCEAAHIASDQGAWFHAGSQPEPTPMQSRAHVLVWHFLFLHGPSSSIMLLFELRSTSYSQRIVCLFFLFEVGLTFSIISYQLQ